MIASVISSPQWSLEVAVARSAAPWRRIPGSLFRGLTPQFAPLTSTRPGGPDGPARPFLEALVDERGKERPRTVPGEQVSYEDPLAWYAGVP